jgi:integrase
VPLTSLALTLLEEMLEIGSYYFTTTGITPVGGFSKAKNRLNRLMTEMVGEDVAEKDDVLKWRLHDLRRTFSTGMAEMGIAPHTVEKLLNHQTGTISGVAAVYNRFEYLEDRRRALEAWIAAAQSQASERP